MIAIQYEYNSTAQWHALVNDAQVACQCQLEEEAESYLVFLLMRYLTRPEFVSKIIALDYLKGSLSQGQLKFDRLREVGDQCLLFSGLFPHQAQKRQVKISYFVKIGQSAYHNLASVVSTENAQLYHSLAYSFVSLMDILHSIREMNRTQPLLQPLIAMELWRETGSKKAFQTVKASAETSIILTDEDATSLN